MLSALLQLPEIGSEMPFEVKAYAQVAGEETMDFPMNPLALAKDMRALWEILWDGFSFL